MAASGCIVVGRGKAPEGEFRGKLSSRGQVVIPRALREWAELREGTPIVFRPRHDGSILLERGAPEESRFQRLRGAWKEDAPAICERLRVTRQSSLDLLSREPHD